MKKSVLLALALVLVLLLATAAESQAQELETAPVKMTVPPPAIQTQAEGELEMYDITFPEEMPLAARNFVLLARAQFEKYPFVKLPKANEYTQWYYRDKREIGWCSVFQIWCSYHSGLQLIKHKQDVTVAEGDCISAMEGRVGNVYYVFDAHGRWQQADKMEAIPKPGYIIIYGKRGSTAYTHVGIVETVTELGDGLYELTTVEGNINSTIKRMNYRYDATPQKKYYNMFEIPEDEITRENCQYTVHKKDWYINGFGATW